MVRELPVVLCMSEIAAIAQRSFAEQMMGDVGIWTGLWFRLEKLISEHERKEKQEKRRKTA